MTMSGVAIPTRTRSTRVPERSQRNVADNARNASAVAKVDPSGSTVPMELALKNPDQRHGAAPQAKSVKRSVSVGVSQRDDNVVTSRYSPARSRTRLPRPATASTMTPLAPVTRLATPSTHV
jgi:hypothetical protein